MSAAREKFASQADPSLLSAIRQIAESEGRQLQVVIEEALRDYVERSAAGVRAWDLVG